ncbi:hypothetical protein OEZ85_008804 [Tetradesmus obliquus]|uniref:Uncharacterized protein n=1 Tax=Tetradesmus obliquus TaxID=3088 RepID=A0ABY8TLY1_TETOB|nr:hypothetical protein OEZ85_008804 [Tetradesmus obliquus]
MQVKAVLDPTAAAAVTQQATAFAIVLAAEAAFSRSNVPEADKGRPQVPKVAAGVGGSLAAALLVGQGGAGVIPTAGLVLGFAVAAGMLAYNTQRALDLQYNDGDWPGPKAWPAGMGLISFFALNVFFQALVQDISTTV